MNPEAKKKLRAVVLKRLRASANDADRRCTWWGRDTFEVSFCPWDHFGVEEFDGDVDGLALPWTDARREMIARGDADPDPEELDQWRRARCEKLARGGEAMVALISPVSDGAGVEGYVVFLGDTQGASTDEPRFYDVYEALDDALADLAMEGAVVAPSW